MLTHSGKHQRPYGCQDCGKSYSHITTLRRHFAKESHKGVVEDVKLLEELLGKELMRDGRTSRPSKTDGLKAKQVASPFTGTRPLSQLYQQARQVESFLNHRQVSAKQLGQPAAAVDQAMLRSPFSSVGMDPRSFMPGGNPWLMDTTLSGMIYSYPPMATPWQAMMAAQAQLLPYPLQRMY